MYKRKFLLTALALFFCLLIFSDVSAMSWRSSDATLQGKVTNEETSQPIPQATVILSKLNKEFLKQAATNTSGSYKIKGKYSGQYLVTVKAAGCQDASSTVTLKKDKTTKADFKLIPLKPVLGVRINSVTPADDSVFLSGSRITIKVTTEGPANSHLEYRFSIGGTIAQPWSNSDSYIWQTKDSDTGLIGILCEVRTNAGQRASRNLSLRVINPSVEDILKKVADNYAKIQDFKADMVLSSTLDGKPFGETEYCRYYFKAPNKEKTEAYADSTRAKKTEIMIIDGSTIHLIDPANNIKQQVDLLSESGLNTIQFSQMDLYYNQANFIKNHNLTRNNTKTDFENFIIAVDIIPREPNNLYSKLELYIDYNKGLMAKLSLYKENKLIQTLEVVEMQQVSNGAWALKKMNKIPMLESGNLVEMATYNDLRINVGLTGLDFDPDKQS